MLGRLFPAKIDNTYHGNVLGLWILGLIVFAKSFMGINVSGLNPWIPSRWVLQNADSVPVDRFGPEAAQAVLFLFSAWGLALLVLSALGLLALLRYRAMTPLMFLLLIIEQLGRRVLSLVHPIERTISNSGLPSGAVINWGLSILLLIGLALSLTPRRGAEALVQHR